MQNIIVDKDGIYIFNWNKYQYKFVPLKTLEEYNITYWIKKVKQKQTETQQKSQQS